MILAWRAFGPSLLDSPAFKPRPKVKQNGTPGKRKTKTGSFNTFYKSFAT
tara:strand:+ start:2014 stop:2163 length:150 start_codon:yes stop_codon:yes gene_type:complete